MHSSVADAASLTETTEKYILSKIENWSVDCRSSGSVDTISLWCLLGRRGEDAEISAGGGRVDLLASDGRVIDMGGEFDVLRIVREWSMSDLTHFGVAPGVGLSIFGEGEAGLGAGGNGNDFAFDAGDLCGDCEDARHCRFVWVHDEGAFWEIVEI